MMKIMVLDPGRKMPFQAIKKSSATNSFPSWALIQKKWNTCTNCHINNLDFQIFHSKIQVKTAIKTNVVNLVIIINITMFCTIQARVQRDCSFPFRVKLAGLAQLWRRVRKVMVLLGGDTTTIDSFAAGFYWGLGRVAPLCALCTIRSTSLRLVRNTNFGQ